MRVPLPAAMITMSSAMHAFARCAERAVSRLRDYRVLRCCAGAAGRLQRGAPGLRPGARPRCTGGSTAMSTSTTRRRRGCARRLDRLVRLAPRAPSCPTTPQLLARAQARGAGRHHAGARVRLVGRACGSRVDAGRSSRPLPDGGRAGADADAGADRSTSSSAMRARPTTSCATTSCRPTRPSGQERRSSAPSSAPRSLYGTLDDAQRDAGRARVAASPFDAERWLAERERRQHDVLQTAAPPGRRGRQRATSAAGGAARARRAHGSVRRASDYRAYQERLAAYNCAFAASLHNAPRAAQRQAAVQKLKGWEDDLRVLAADAASDPSAAPGRSSGRVQLDRHAARVDAAGAGSPSAPPRTSPAAATLSTASAPSLLARASYSGWPLVRSRISSATSRS